MSPYMASIEHSELMNSQNSQWIDKDNRTAFCDADEFEYKLPVLKSLRPSDVCMLQ